MINYLRIMIDAQRAKMDERGASAVEYGLLIAGIAALIVLAVFALGPTIKEAFTDTCDAITSGDNNTVTGECIDEGTPE
jgi:pilus assembly protein Flp/PilA